jgi:adenine-specific DNA-methyltransferase
MARSKSDKSTPIGALKHRDKRANIPTEELRDFVVEDEERPKSMLYPRDPSRPGHRHHRVERPDP